MVLGEAAARKSYKEVMVGLEKSTANTTTCRIQSAVPIAIVSKVRCANSQGGPEEVNPNFSLKDTFRQSMLQTV